MECRANDVCTAGVGGPPCTPPDNIRDMTVAQTRKALQQVRAGWRNHSPDTPMCPSMRIHNGMTAERFNFLFVLDHHERRHRKSASARRSSGVPTRGAAKRTPAGGKRLPKRTKNRAS